MRVPVRAACTTCKKNRSGLTGTVSTISTISRRAAHQRRTHGVHNGDAGVDVANKLAPALAGVRTLPQQNDLGLHHALHFYMLSGTSYISRRMALIESPRRNMAAQLQVCGSSRTRPQYCNQSAKTRQSAGGGDKERATSVPPVCPALYSPRRRSRRPPCIRSSPSSPPQPLP